MTYSRAQVCSILRLKPGRLRYWERLGLLRAPAQGYDWSQLARARSLAQLAQAGVSLARLTPEIEWVGALHRQPVVRDRQGLRLAPSGQGLLDFEPGPTLQVHPQGPRVWLEQARQESGVESLERALQLDPELSEAWHLYGLRLFGAGAFAQARDSWRRLVELRPRDQHACFNLALALEECGQLEESQLQLEQALQLRPGYARAHYNLARLLERQGRSLHAWRHWHAFLQLQPEGPYSQAVRHYLQRTR